MPSRHSYPVFSFGSPLTKQSYSFFQIRLHIYWIALSSSQKKISPAPQQGLPQTFKKCGMSLVFRTNSCASKPPQIRPSSNRMIKIRMINPIPPLG
jgi:hypothetical protein